MQVFEQGTRCPACGGPGSLLYIDGMKDGRRAGWTSLMCRCDDPAPVWDGGEERRQLRKERGITLAVAAQHLGIEAPDLSLYEQGKARPDPPLLSRWTALVTAPVAPPAGEVVHVADHVPGAVYIGRANGRARLRASPFHNPYREGDPHDSIPRRDRLTRRQVVDLYEAYLRARPFLLRQLPDLRGRPLECWCRRRGQARTEETACHGDVLLALLTEFTDEQLRGMR